MAITATIPQLNHGCEITSGPYMGRIQYQGVTSADIKYGIHCSLCGKPKATMEDLVLHMYAQLTGE